MIERLFIDPDISAALQKRRRLVDPKVRRRRIAELRALITGIEALESGNGFTVDRDALLKALGVHIYDAVKLGGWNPEV